MADEALKAVVEKSTSGDFAALFGVAVLVIVLLVALIVWLLIWMNRRSWDRIDRLEDRNEELYREMHDLSHGEE